MSFVGLIINSSKVLAVGITIYYISNTRGNKLVRASIFTEQD